MRAFGVTADGHTIHSATLAWPGGLELQVIEYGAIVHRLGFPASAGRRQAILGFDALSDYERDTGDVGACVGRFANRIAGGRFELDGRTVQLSVNEPPNTLHGGKVGFNKRIGGSSTKPRTAAPPPSPTARRTARRAFPGRWRCGRASP